MSKNSFVCMAAIAALTLAVTILLLAACGHRRSQPVQLTLTAPVAEQPGNGQESAGGGEAGTGGVLPGVLALDALAAGACRSVRSGTQVMSFGADYSPEGSGTTSDREYSIEPSETSLNLRAFVPGDYAYALYRQKIDGSPKPLQTLIDSEVCSYGGGQDDDIPLVYFLGFADYSVGSWRWFGPFRDVDVMVQVNSESLKSRFKSPNDNFYLCVMTTNPGRAASSLPAEGLAAEFPFEPMARLASEDAEDPGGVTIEAVVTDTEEGLDTEPAVVTGLEAFPDTDGVTLRWDVNIDPDVFMYQVFRDDRDDEDAKVLIQGIPAPDVEYRDETGEPGKQYEYSVRALKLGGLEGGGFAAAIAARSLAAPTVTASDGAFSDHVHIEWTSIEGAVGYSVLRADAIDGAKAELASVDAAILNYNDYDAVLEQIYYYWVRALGEDVDGQPGGPDSGFCIELEPVQVTATDGDYPDRVELVWGEEPLAESYNVYRDTDEVEGGDEFLGSVVPPDHSYSDYTAPWAEPRFYFVKPVVLSAEQARGIGDWGHRGLAVPGNVTATQGTNADKVTVSWETVNNATRYRVFRADSPEDPSPLELPEVAAPATGIDDAPDGWSGTEGQHYFYFVAALHGGPDEERSDFGSAEGWRGIGTPATVTATNGTLGDRVAISWSAVSQATVYQVFRDGSPIGEPIEAPTTTYTDYGTAFNAHHDYAVKAGIDLGYGPMSASDEGWRGLLAPANVQASDGEYTDKIAVTWGLVNTATGYRIYRSEIDDDPSPPFLASVTGGTTTSYDDFSAVPNTQYWYSVSAFIDSQANDGLRSADDVGTIGNKSPVADLSADPTEGDAPLTVNFDASDSYDDDGSIVKYEWDWTNDGTYDHDSGTDPTVSHEYTTAGEYTCKLRVTDDDGAEDTNTVTVKVYKWWTETVDSVGDSGQYCSLDFDASGNPAISYLRVDGGLKYAQWNTLSWEKETADNLDYAGYWTSLRFDSSGRPSIAYQRQQAMQLKFAVKDGTWDLQVVDTDINSYNELGKDASLAYDLNGNPGIAYRGLGDLRYAHYDEGEWSKEIVDNVDNPGRYCSLAFDSSGHPAISYKVWGTGHLKWAHYNGTDWDKEYADTTVGIDIRTSIMFASGDVPLIAYFAETGSDLKFAEKDGSWSTELVDSAGYVGQYTSLDLDGAGLPGIAYYDDDNTALKCAKSNGSTWDILTIDSDDDVGKWASIRFDQDSFPSIAYYDTTNTALKYAHYGPSLH